MDLIKKINKTAGWTIIFVCSMYLIGARWAAFLKSPIFGIHLPEFLLILAVLIIVITDFISVRNLKLSTLAPQVVVILFVMAKLFWSTIMLHHSLSDGLRDSAPLLILSIVPIIVVGVNNLDIKCIFSAIRYSVTIYLILFVLICFQFLKPFSSILLGTNDARVLEYGGDLIGVMIGLGYILWSSEFVKGKLPYLFRVLIIGLVFLHNSRGGMLASLAMIFLSLLSINRYVWKNEIFVITVGALLAIGLQAINVNSYYGVPYYSAHINEKHKSFSADVNQNNVLKKLPKFTSFYSSIDSVDDYKKILVEDDEYFFPSWTGARLQHFIDASGTIGARIATWIIVSEYTYRKGIFLLGASYGSDVLHRSCANPNLPHYGTKWPGGGINGPKCPIDSNETSRPVRDSHNFLLTIYIYNGLLGLLFLFYMLYKYLVINAIIEHRYHYILLIALFGYAVSGLFSTFASYPFVLVPCALMLALLQYKEITDG